MKLVYLLLCISVLTGCSKPLNQQHLQMAENYCKDKGGIFSLEAPTQLLVMWVTCKNGERANTNTIND